MNWTFFPLVLLTLYALSIIQAFCAFEDGYLSRRQMLDNKIYNGYSFFQHGGVWIGNILVTSPLIAYLFCVYDFKYLSIGGLLTLLVVVISIFVFGNMYAREARSMPEAHTHDGKTTAAGWFYGLYSLLVFWFILAFYCGLTVDPITRFDLLLTSIALTFFFYFGVVKFTKKWWKLDAKQIVQVAVEIVLLWVITFIKLSGMN